MVWTFVNSSFIEAIGFDGRTLAVMIHGRTYFYLGVSPALHRDFLNAESPGDFYNAFVKGHYQ
jgi:hypothetical protein